MRSQFRRLRRMEVVALGAVSTLVCLTARSFRHFESTGCFATPNFDQRKAVGEKEVPTGRFDHKSRGREEEIPAMMTGTAIIKTLTPWESKNRTLVILLGDLRCGEKAWSTLYENVLDFLQADLALFTQPAPQLAYQSASLLDRALHVEMLPDYTDWGDALDLMSTGWRERVAAAGFNSSTHNQLLGGVENYAASGAIVHMYKWVAAVRIQQLWMTHYDRFIVTRTDQFYHCPLNLSAMDPAFVWVPEGEDYSGITDRFLIASSDKIVAALDTLSPFLKDPSKFSSDNSFYPAYTNCEYFFRIMLIYAGLWPHHVRRFPRVMFTCMAKGDRTRWAVMNKFVKEGVNLKYPTEYEISSRVCKAGH
jgi:hypothetical protein